MLVRAYLQWMATASVAERVEAVSVMAGTLLSRCLAHEDAIDAEAALIMALEDPALAVRRALAEAVAADDAAPRSIVIPLAHDVSAVAAHVLLKSNVLSDADLLDAVVSGDAIAQTAVALRPSVSAAVAGAIARHGALDAVIALIANDYAEIRPADFLIAAERHKASGELRGVMLEREDLPIAVRQLLVSAASDALRGMLSQTGWLSPQRTERCVMEAERQASVGLAAECDSSEISELMETLRKSGRLTPNLLMRAVLCGETRMLAATLAMLSGLPLSRVSTIMQDPSGSAFACRYDRAAMPASLKAAFAAALQAGQRAVAADGRSLDITIVRERSFALRRRLATPTPRSSRCCAAMRPKRCAPSRVISRRNSLHRRSRSKALRPSPPILLPCRYSRPMKLPLCRPKPRMMHCSSSRTTASCRNVRRPEPPIRRRRLPAAPSSPDAPRQTGLSPAQADAPELRRAGCRPGHPHARSRGLHRHACRS